ncbi:uncharacterized protein MAM_08204 [Metarhizium album ARSEF 1941]|uniref:Uncharacterized protein n=1 Tax=Metarhizium album (strain ARSEF 1941) TaxID=1081103 RepID=A0A0B2WJR4_METAS|nr:uncharacterized protein MAM_08204 [Metarhizium album ARSEF 1941]KHN93949.1 hypothetical protein MAM_08204 [Metarhizium album ARSEF 1941]
MEDWPDLEVEPLAWAAASPMYEADVTWLVRDATQRMLASCNFGSVLDAHHDPRARNRPGAVTLPITNVGGGCSVKTVE